MRARKAGLLFAGLLAVLAVLHGLTEAQQVSGGATSYRAVYENLSGSLGRFRFDTSSNYYVFGSSRQYAGAVVFSSGSLVAQSTSSTNAHPVFQVLNNAASLIMKVTQQGRVGIGVASPSTTLDVNGTVNATAFTGDGSALTGVTGVNSTNTWTAANYYSGAVNISSPTSSLVVGSSLSITGAVFHPVRVSTSLPNLTVPAPSSLYAENLPKAYVHFIGSGTVTIQGAFNVTSITDNAAGDYTLNFGRAFADTNYICQCTPYDNDSTAGWCTQVTGTGSGFQTVSAFRVKCTDTVGTAADQDKIMCTCYGRQ